MATLVQFLAAGVNGAESGSATFLLRGTASSAEAVLYNDFERTAQPGTNVITLDANGAAEVYCSAYVDVTIRNSAGTTLRTVTVGNGSDNVEVRSDSFKGTDYDGNPANTAGEPLTLTAALDKWSDSAGTTDFQVLIDGVATNLSSAFGALGTLTFINVKDPTYGATGDGVTDDTTAITAALAAAGGAIVFFPPGNYLVSAPITLSDANFHLMGSGPNVSQIGASHSGSHIFQCTDTTAGSYKTFSGLGFLGSTTRSLLLNLAPNVRVSNCTFVRRISRSNSAGSVSLIVENCRFALSGTEPAVLNNSAVGQSSICIRDCVFDIEAGYTGAIISGPDTHVSGCLFDASLVTSGIYWHIKPSNNSNQVVTGTIVGNEFRDGGSSGFVFDLRVMEAGSSFYEDDNVCTGFTAPAALTEAGHIYNYSNGGSYDDTSILHLGSRLGKQLRFTNSSSSSLSGVQCFLVADTIVIDHTNASNLSVGTAPGEKPIGLNWNCIVLNNSGGARDISINGTGQTPTLSAVPDGGRALASLFTYLETTDTVCTGVVGAASAVV